MPIFVEAILREAAEGKRSTTLSLKFLTLQRKIIHRNTNDNAHVTTHNAIIPLTIVGKMSR